MEILGEFENNENREYPDEVKVTLVYYEQAIARNRRYLFSYIYHRLNRIRELRWETGVVVPDKIRQGILSSRELDYFSEYNNILNEYNTSLDLDLTADVMPPKDLFIEVLVLEDCGDILTENGFVSLNKGTRPFLRRSDIEHLIKQGKCLHIPKE